MKRDILRTPLRGPLDDQYAIDERPPDWEEEGGFWEINVRPLDAEQVGVDEEDRDQPLRARNGRKPPATRKPPSSPGRRRGRTESGGGSSGGPNVDGSRAAEGLVSNHV